MWPQQTSIQPPPCQGRGLRKGRGQPGKSPPPSFPLSLIPQPPGPMEVQLQVAAAAVRALWLAAESSGAGGRALGHAHPQHRGC